MKKPTGSRSPNDSPYTPRTTTPQMSAGSGSEDTTRPSLSQSVPSLDQIKGQWKQQIGAARIAWGKLTDDELMTIEGHQQKLAGLVQERYAVSRDEAERQVKTFFAKYLN